VAPKEKPYRIYRGGRVKGPIRPEPLRKERRQATDGSIEYPKAKPRRPSWRRWAKRGLLVLAVLFVLAIVWGVLGYLSFRGGVQDANERLSQGARAALAPQDGMLLTSPTNILVLGIDEGGVRGRATSVSRYPAVPASRRSMRRTRTAALRLRFARCRASPAYRSTTSSWSTSARSRR
jgi:hypothetical protein